MPSFAFKLNDLRLGLQRSGSPRPRHHFTNIFEQSTSQDVVRQKVPKRCTYLLRQCGLGEAIFVNPLRFHFQLGFLSWPACNTRADYAGKSEPMSSKSCWCGNAKHSAVVQGHSISVRHPSSNNRNCTVHSAPPLLLPDGNGSQLKTFRNVLVTYLGIRVRVKASLQRVGLHDLSNCTFTSGFTDSFLGGRKSS